MPRRRERFPCWQWLGHKDIVVYSTGGDTHWVEVTAVDDGRLVEKKRFGGRYARQRAIDYAAELKYLAEESHLIATTCFHCGDPAIPETHGRDPRCERHYDV